MLSKQSVLLGAGLLRSLSPAALIPVLVLQYTDTDTDRLYFNLENFTFMNAEQTVVLALIQV